MNAPLCPKCKTERLARRDGRKPPGAIPGRKHYGCVPRGYARTIAMRPPKK